MHSEWEFKFKSFDFRFDKEYKFKGNLNSNNDQNLNENIPQSISFRFRIKPSDKLTHGNIKQIGSLYITVPLPFKKAEKIVYLILYQIIQRIKFQFGKFEIESGFIIGEHIPETKEEIEFIGDKKYFAKFAFEEVLPESTFEPNMITKIPSVDIGLVSLYNNANQANHIMEKFLGYYKILEDTYSKNKRGEKIKEKFKNDELFKIYSKVVDKNNKDLRTEFENFIDSIVDARHKCSHLKNKKEYGYLPDDPKLEIEVEPYLNLMQILSYKLILSLQKP